MLQFLMKQLRRNFLILLIILSIISPLSKANQPNCTYSIEIETTCAPSAETTDHISIRFGDSSGNWIVLKRLKDPKLLYAPKNGLKKGGGGFQRCSIDMFEAKGVCMKQSVCALYLKRVGSDEWRPGWVKVLHHQQEDRVILESYRFYFRTFVPENVWYGFDYCHSSKAGFMPHARYDLTFDRENEN